jgi:hypothetical protein
LFSKEAAAFVLQNTNPESFTGDIAMQIILHLYYCTRTKPKKKKKQTRGSWHDGSSSSAAAAASSSS